MWGFCFKNGGFTLGLKEKYEAINNMNKKINEEDIQEDNVKNKVIYKSVSMGSIMACVISWSLNQSFWWMFFHGILGWFYIIYWSIFT